ncbi:MoaD/ThiS family protein [Aridibaculum aurantiacum]|uniref:MoaD/ThiS family protein n=1 Tax=Aridibaculum aurantiacum TaxID=2810307 RepID=UPI001A9710E8|nr:MoaD/ThiS family protein [Aridibaculum aurantiacum]
MKVNLLAFGKVAEVTGNHLTLEEEVHDTDALNTFLLSHYPALHCLTYLLAVDKEIIHSNTQLKENVTVALLPPFSGG